MNFHEATVLDFTGSVRGAIQRDSFTADIVNLLRGNAKNKTIVVIDRGLDMPTKETYIVSDHINLTGSNPLIGPNDPVGARFPVVNDIYVSILPEGCTSVKATGVVGGLKPGIQPTEAEKARARELGVDFFSHHLAQVMLAAAHAGWKVLGLVVPEGEKLPADVVAALEKTLSKETV